MIKVEIIKHSTLVIGIPIIGLTKAYEKPQTPNSHNTKIWIKYVP
jgi:hypothetical protein